MSEIGVAFISQARLLLKTDYLPKIERCLEKISDEDVWWRPNADSNSIGNLLLHLSGNARQWIVAGVGGAQDARDRDREFEAREGLGRAELLDVLERTIDDVDLVLSSVQSGSLLDWRIIQGSEVSVLEAIFHVVEHFSMHTGQIILLTKTIAQSDLRLYDFSTGAPQPNWNS